MARAKKKAKRKAAKRRKTWLEKHLDWRRPETEQAIDDYTIVGVNAEGVPYTYSKMGGGIGYVGTEGAWAYAEQLGLIENPTVSEEEMRDIRSRAAQERLAETMGLTDIYELQELEEGEGESARSVVARVMARKKKAKEAKKAKKNPDSRAILRRAMRGT